jgi:site-specific DNA-adenine methylase
MNFLKIPYPGGKARMASTLVSFMPQSGQTYVEPFAGRGNVFWAAAASGLKFDHWHLNDIRTANFFNAIRCIGEHVDVPVRSRDEYLQQWSAYKMQDLRATLLEAYLSFGGAGSSRKGV